MRESGSLLARLRRAGLSWFVVGLGLLVGALGIVGVELAPVFAAEGAPWQRCLVAGFAAFAGAELAASVIAIRSRKTAGLLLLVAGPIVAAWFGLSEWLASREVDSLLFGPVPIVTVSLLLLAIPGAFWLGTSRVGWPPLTSAQTRPRRRTGVYALVVPLLLAGSVFAGLFVSLYAPTLRWTWSDEAESAPVSSQRFPEHVVFVGRVLFVATLERNTVATPWCVLRIERRYWGIPSWAPDYVIARGPFEGDERGVYLVDARRSPRLVTRFLPVVEAYSGCHTERLDLAAVDVRVLRDGPPRSGVRVIGRVYQGGSAHFFDRSGGPARGVKVRITGPGGTSVVTTGGDGIYDFAEQPAGHYSVEVQNGAAWASSPLWERDMQAGEVWGPTMRVGVRVH